MNNLQTIFTQGMINQLPFLFRILLSCICGGLIGLERTKRQKNAGFRTHCIVAIGASLSMIISKYAFFDVVIYDSVQVDASRIASTLLTSVSFLGAGMIFMKSSNIKGLTTAAGIWATAAVGMAIGSGLYFVGIVSTLLIIVIQVIFHIFPVGFDKVIDHDVRSEMVVSIKNNTEAIGRLKEQFESYNIEIVDGHMEISSKGEKLTLSIPIRSKNEIDFSVISQIVQNNEDIYSLSVEG